MPGAVLTLLTSAALSFNVCNANLQDEYNLVHVDPPLAFCTDLTKVKVTCTATVVDINEHENSEKMRKSCFAIFFSHYIDKRFTEQSCQALKEQDEASLALLANNV